MSDTSDKRKKGEGSEGGRIEEILKELGNFDYICSGTLLKRTKVCGKPGCRCARDPDARHGPYYEWNRRQDGRLLHRVITPSEFLLVERAISNHRRILELLAEWEQLSIPALVEENPSKRRKGQKDKRREIHSEMRGK